MEKTSDTSVIFFDGVCNMCNGAVQFIIRHDQHKKFRFASLQSEYARQIMLASGIDPKALHSLLLYEGGVIYQRSTAALRIASHLKGYSFLSYFRVVPLFIRDAVYNLIAKNRYRLFGKRDECMIPSPDMKARFIA